jgi:ketosteroid isomerase-like protein
MLRSALGLLIAMSLAAAVWAHPPAQLSDEAEKIAIEEATAFRKALGKAIAAKDIKTLQDMYNDSFVHTHPSGKVVGKEEHIAAILKGDAVIETAPAEDVRIRVPGGWTAVATGLSRMPAPTGAYAVRWTAVYVRGERGFEVAASHATKLGDAK